MAQRYDVDPYLVAAVARSESDFDPEAVSQAGAVGIMQIMPATAAWITQLASWQGKAHPNLKTPADNLELGTCYLAYLLGRFDESTRAAVAAYNAGQGAVSGWLSNGTLALADIPFGETRAFVEKVEHYHSLYLRIHPRTFAAGPTASVSANSGRGS